MARGRGKEFMAYIRSCIRPKTAEERFAKLFTKAGPDECWLWTGTKVKDGYGHFAYQGRMQPAHRVALMLEGVEIPAGMFIDHMCRTAACVNPRHLRIVTPGVNTLENNDNFAAVNARKTHCPACELPYEGENLALVPRKRKGKPDSFGRICLNCYPWYWKYAVVPREKPPRGYSVKR